MFSVFRFTGCLGNKNNFPSMNVCKRQCHHDWNDFAAMRLVDKKTGKAVVKAHVCLEFSKNNKKIGSYLLTSLSGAFDTLT